MTDAEFELHIADLGRLIEKAYAEGDRASAVAWAKAMAEAKNCLSAEWVQARETALGLGPCQFVVAGDAARAALESRGA